MGKEESKPKRPQTAYQLWLAENRAAMVEELGKNSVPQIARLGGEKWRNMSDEDKASWEVKANDNKAMRVWQGGAAPSSDDDEEAHKPATAPGSDTEEAPASAAMSMNRKAFLKEAPTPSRRKSRLSMCLKQ